MTSLVLPGDRIPTPSGPRDPSTVQSVTYGPGIGTSTSRHLQSSLSTPQEDNEDKHTPVALRMGNLNTHSKRKRTKQGQTEEITRQWIEVESKRASPFLSTTLHVRMTFVLIVIMLDHTVCSGSRGRCDWYYCAKTL